MASVIDIIVLDDDDDEEGPSLPSEAMKSPVRVSPPTVIKNSPASAPPPPTEAKKSPARASSPLTEVKKVPASVPPPLTEAKKSPARASPPLTEAKKSPARASPLRPETPARASPAPLPSEPEGKEKKEKDKSQIKAAQCNENKKLFEEFVEYCSNLTSDNPEVIEYLQGRFSKANPDYISSVEFRNNLGRCLSRVQSKRSKVFVYINELCTVLKSHTQKKRLSLKPQATPQTETLSQNFALKPGTSDETPEANEEVTETKPASKRQIRYLENLLRLYAQEIQKLQEKELSLDDLADEDSTYIQESRLKRKLLRIFEKLCELKDCSSLTGRVIEQRIQYKGTRYPEINRRLEKFINKERDVFPDYGDVFQVVQRTNDKHDLGLTRKQMQSMAQDAFRELGNKLQDRRHLDMVYNFGCHLTDAYKTGLDPASQDTMLARRLRENRSMAVNRLEDIIKKYAEMQDDGEDDGWKNKKNHDVPSTSKEVKLTSIHSKITVQHICCDKHSPRKKQTSSSESESEDEDSEESDVDIEEELKQSEQAVDNEEDEEGPAEEGNEADQKMDEVEKTDVSQNPSPAAKEEGENKEGNDGKDDDDPMEEGEDEEQQESPLGSTSLSSEKDSSNVSMESEADTMHSASPGNSNDAPPAGEAEECTEQQQEDKTCHETTTELQTEEQPEVCVPADDSTEKKEPETAHVPYIVADISANQEQGARNCMDTKDNPTDTKSPMVKKEVKVGRLDQCISKLAGTLTHKGSKEKVLTAGKESPPASPLVESALEVKPEERNCKLVCVDTPANSQDSVRKIAFSHTQSVDAGPHILHLDAEKDSGTHSNTSNGVHRALVRPPTPVNRLRLRKPTTNDSPATRDRITLIKLEKQSPQRSKRKGSPQLWTENRATNCNGSENGGQTNQEAKRTKLECSSASVSSPSEAGSDNEPDITLDMMVTCSPMTP
ncbi:death domain-associated protein 6, partial [Gastrophryne carolinensis]